MNPWTKKPPTRPGWYWRVQRGEKPKPYAISREDSPDYTEPIISATGPDADCERVGEPFNYIMWSVKPIEPPPAPKWAKTGEIEVKP